jgi:hypothetical protein
VHIILRDLGLEVSVYKMFTFQTSFKPLLLKGGGGGGGGVKSICRDDCDYQGGKLLRLLSYPNYVQEFGLSMRNTVGLVPGYSSICISSRKFSCENMIVTTYYTVL